jgi:hypothetical protein
VVLLESRRLKISADPFIDPVARLPGQHTAHKADVSTGFAELKLHTGPQLIILRDGIRRQEGIIQSVQDQSGCFNVFYGGAAAGTTIVFIDTLKTV